MTPQTVPFKITSDSMDVRTSGRVRARADGQTCDHC